ncbi:MAG: hypothetical protein PHT96_13340 [Syntrophorhabdaceae bacterium]|nr:hypothetical protein [Syntrophorhabdaceae bacterium]MDD4197368.1 hypothetical protein [Syntrophorhabdaceae bacterium]
MAFNPRLTLYWLSLPLYGLQNVTRLELKISYKTFITPSYRPFSVKSVTMYLDQPQLRDEVARRVWAVKLKIFIVPLIAASLWACSTCRVTSVEDAARYSERGYKTRTAVYKTGLGGRLWGGFFWTHHVQAQVLVGNEWKWVGASGLSDTSSFTVAGDEIYYWRAGDYASFLKQQNRYTKSHPIACRGRSSTLRPDPFPGGQAVTKLKGP